MPLTNAGRQKNEARELVFFFIISYMLTWAYCIPEALSSHNLIPFKMPLFLEVIGAYGPALAAILTISVFSGRQGLMKLFRRLSIWRVNFKWYILILLIQPGIWLAATGIHAVFAGEVPDFGRLPVQKLISDQGSVNPLFTILLIFISQVLSLLGEEAGWRGYALPKLLHTKNWIMSSLILGTGWAIWHIPLFLIQGSTQSQLPAAWYFVDLLASAFIFTWVFLNTKGSLLISLLFHASINASTVLLLVFPSTAYDMGTYLLGITLKLLVAAGILFLYKPGNISDKKIEAGLSE